MIKNYKKRRSADKKGVILVTVLFILAMAMIFISCALVLTSATRSRVYEKTAKSQARLTLTSAVETFYQALQMQEITDDALEAYADGNVTMQIIMDDNAVPGTHMAGPTGNKDNVTYAHFYNHTISGNDYVVVDITTKIGESQENARMFLFENEIPDPPDLFSSQVDFNGPLGNNFRGSIGQHSFATNPSDNIVVWRGDYRCNQSQATTTWSDMLFIGGNGGGNKSAYWENNEVIKGDVIFLDNYRWAWNSTAPSITGDVYFVGPGGRDDSFMSRNSEAVGQTSRTYATNNSVWMFANRTTNGSGSKDNIFGAIKGSKATLFLKNSGASWDSSVASNISSASGFSDKENTWKTNYSSTYSKQITKMKKFYTTDTSSLVQVYPTTAQMKSQYGMPTSSADCTGYTSTSFSSLLSTYNGQIIPPGNYIISGDGGSVGSAKSTPNVALLDGTADYMFFINESTELVSGVFAVINPTQAHHQYFILAPNCNLQIGHNNNDDGKFYAGFLSVARSGSNDTGYASTIRGYGNMFNSLKGGHDGVQKPTIQFYCMDNNDVTWTRGGAVEAYFGMFQSSYGSQTSSITVYNCTNTQFSFYGRVMATDIFNTSSDFVMPYCPAPNTHAYEEYTEVSSKYKVNSLQYYYGTGNIIADPTAST